jgi:hypothetical protein
VRRAAADYREWQIVMISLVKSAFARMAQNPAANQIAQSEVLAI